MSDNSLQGQLKMIHEDLIGKFVELKKENESIKMRLRNIETKLGVETGSSIQNKEKQYVSKENNIGPEQKTLNFEEEQLISNDRQLVSEEMKLISEEVQLVSEEKKMDVTEKQLGGKDKQLGKPNVKAIKENRKEKQTESKANTVKYIEEHQNYEDENEEDNFDNFDMTKLQEQGRLFTSSHICYPFTYYIRFVLQCAIALVYGKCMSF